MNSIIHKAESRGHANHGWLDTYHTFSFASYMDSSRMHFGVLRVLNDDTVAGGMGFGMHPHDNMEIITIPLEGDLAHKDSMGNASVIRKGDIQVMSAGTGIYHSEYNQNADQEVSLLQIWIYPKMRNVTPRYDQLTLDLNDRKNKLQQVLSPNQDDEGVWIYQDAWFHMANVDTNHQLKYDLKKEGNGVYAFVISGSFEIDGIELSTRDGLGISETNQLEIKSLAENSEILLMEIPMTLAR